MIGFLAPSGIFYECREHEYALLAEEMLKLEYHKKSEYPVRILCELNWVLIEKSYVGFSDGDKYEWPRLTQEQKRWLIDNRENMTAEQQLSIHICLELDESLHTIVNLRKRVSKLKKGICSELLLKPSVYGSKLAQHDYEAFLRESEVEVLTDEKSKELLVNKFGFAKDLLRIITTAEIYKTDDEMTIFDVKKYDRRPLYARGETFYDSELSYILFRCSLHMYELINGSLFIYEHPDELP